ncbi:MAG: hypothetical protein ACRYGF_06280, partial [Janthinobacterium lividum]
MARPTLDWERRRLLLTLVFAGTLLHLTGCGGGWGEAAPTIKAGIVSNSVNVGGALVLTASPTGIGPFTYQWFRNSVSVAGATAQSYTHVVQASDNGAVYTVQISNAAGTTTSLPFVLALGNSPIITSQPIGVTVMAGQAANFTVATTGTSPMSYQWFRNGSMLSGATSNSYTTPITSTTDSGALFAVTVSNAIGSVKSESAAIIVTPLPPSLTFNSVTDKTYADGTFLVSASSSSPAPIDYTVTSGPATVSGAAVTVNGVGTVVLSASQAAAGNYAATTATTSFAVKPATPVLTFRRIPKETFGDPAFVVSATSASSAPVTYSVVSGPATVSGSTVTLTGAG